MKPPYEITSKILNLISLISERIGEIKSARLVKPPTELRKRNRIKTIQSSLGIEGNSMTIEQITDLINNKRVLAPQKDKAKTQLKFILSSMISLFTVWIPLQGTRHIDEWLN
jgi:Fic family protein